MLGQCLGFMFDLFCGVENLTFKSNQGRKTEPLEEYILTNQIF